ncbi:uncharacterized protein UTRI_06252_B [Ustilago trichophora]|uniref:Uncharacterized protein n=1 Tax=Ustilago trichophora TaxID=86804 RepID=A0A5C3EJP3_9BASI|nr:uncharacterized protein UTRI_06252_B [Ustilago trichophora]
MPSHPFSNNRASHLSSILLPKNFLSKALPGMRVLNTSMWQYIVIICAVVQLINATRYEGPLQFDLFGPAHLQPSYLQHHANELHNALRVPFGYDSASVIPTSDLTVFPKDIKEFLRDRGDTRHLIYLGRAFDGTGLTLAMPVHDRFTPRNSHRFAIISAHPPSKIYYYGLVNVWYARDVHQSIDQAPDRPPLSELAQGEVLSTKELMEELRYL